MVHSWMFLRINQLLHLHPGSAAGKGLLGSWMFTRVKSPVIHNDLVHQLYLHIISWVKLPVNVVSAKDVKLRGFITNVGYLG